MFSMTSSVSSPKCLTMRLAVTGPTPLIMPLPRYFSMPAIVAGKHRVHVFDRELAAVFRVQLPLAAYFDEFAHIKGRHVAYQGDLC